MSKNSNDVVITSASYSNGCNAGYTSLASDLDAQNNLYPSFFQASSSEMFANTSDLPLSEASEMTPRSPILKLNIHYNLLKDLQFLYQLSSP